MNTSVLVVGATGFLGTAICQGLVEQGKSVIAVGSKRKPEVPGVESSLRWASQGPSDTRALMENIHSVIYLASASTPGSSAGKPMLEVNENLAPLAALLEAMGHASDKKLIYFSSAGALYGTPRDGIATELHLPQPRSYHGAAKVAAEHFIQAWTLQTGSKATILRPSNVYGPGQIAKSGFGIIPAALGCILRGEPLTIWGNGEAVRDYLFIDDMVSLTLTALDSDEYRGARTINAASGRGVSINELLNLLERTTGRPLVRAYSTGRPVDMDRVLVGVKHAEAVLGWQPGMSLEKGLERTWNWFASIHQ